MILQNVKEILTSKISVSSASFSRDGSQIVFSGFQQGNYNLFLIEASGQNLTRLTNGISYSAADDSADESGYFQPIFTHDGKAIVCLRIAPPPPWAPDSFQMCVLDVESRAMTMLADTGDGQDPCCSPKDDRIVFTSYRDGWAEIYSVHSDGSSLTRLTNTDARSALGHSFLSWNGSPIYSPEGSHIAFLSGPPNANSGMPVYVNVMRSDGSERKTLPAVEGRCGSLVWDLAGRKIAFDHASETASDIFTTEMRVFDIVSEDLRVVYRCVEPRDVTISTIGLSADSEHLFIQRSVWSLASGKVDSNLIYLLHIQSGDTRLALPDLEFSNQVAHCISPDGKLLLFQIRGNGGSSLYLADSLE